MPITREQAEQFANSPIFSSMMQRLPPDKQEEVLQKLQKGGHETVKPVEQIQGAVDDVLKLPTDIMSKVTGMPKNIFPIILIGGALLLVVMVIK